MAQIIGERTALQGVTAVDNKGVAVFPELPALIALTIPDLQNVGYFSVSCNWNTSRKLLKTVIAAININMQVLQIETSSSYFTLQITIDETFLRNFLEY